MGPWVTRVYQNLYEFVCALWPPSEWAVVETVGTLILTAALLWVAFVQVRLVREQQRHTKATERPWVLLDVIGDETSITSLLERDRRVHPPGSGWPAQVRATWRATNYGIKPAWITQTWAGLSVCCFTEHPDVKDENRSAAETESVIQRLRTNLEPSPRHPLPPDGKGQQHAQAEYALLTKVDYEKLVKAAANPLVPMVPTSIVLRVQLTYEDSEGRSYDSWFAWAWTVVAFRGGDDFAGSPAIVASGPVRAVWTRYT